MTVREELLEKMKSDPMFMLRLIDENQRLREDPPHVLAREVGALRVAVEQVAASLESISEDIRRFVDRGENR